MDSARHHLETAFENDGASVVHTIYRPCLPPTTVRWNDKHIIGRGANGTVTLQEGTDGQLRAVKRVLEPASYTREVAALAKVSDRHDLFVEFLGWYEDKHFLYIAMEYVEHGDLSTYLENHNQPIPEDTCREITKQVLKGLEVLHERQICHRDLKPQNILVSSPFPIRVKISDFGASKYLKDTQFRTRIGTNGYLAPEILGLLSPATQRAAFGYSVDIWSAGCIVYEILSSRRPFSVDRSGEVTNEPVSSSIDHTEISVETDMMLFMRFCHGEVPLPLGALEICGASVESMDLVKALLRADPSSRLSASESLQLPWLLGETPTKSHSINNGVAQVMRREGPMEEAPKIRISSGTQPIPSSVKGGGGILSIGISRSSPTIITALAFTNAPTGHPSWSRGGTGLRAHIQLPSIDQNIGPHGGPPDNPPHVYARSYDDETCRRDKDGFSEAPCSWLVAAEHGSPELFRKYGPTQYLSRRSGASGIARLLESASASIGVGPADVGSVEVSMRRSVGWNDVWDGVWEKDAEQIRADYSAIRQNNPVTASILNESVGRPHYLAW